MKKLIAFVWTLLLVATITCGCSNKSSDNSTKSTNNDIPQNSITKEDPQSTTAISAPPVSDKSPQSTKLCVGMSQSDYRFIVPEGNRFDYNNYSFTQLDDSSYTMVRFDNKSFDVIDELHTISIDSLDCSHESFAGITKGMTILEVVSKVGIPQASTTFGLESTLFIAEDGTPYNVYWTREDDSLVVSSVVRLDNISN